MHILIFQVHFWLQQFEIIVLNYMKFKKLFFYKLTQCFWSRIELKRNKAFLNSISFLSTWNNQPLLSLKHHWGISALKFQSVFTKENSFSFAWLSRKVCIVISLIFVDTNLWWNHHKFFILLSCFF